MVGITLVKDNKVYYSNRKIDSILYTSDMTLAYSWHDHIMSRRNVIHRRCGSTYVVTVAVDGKDMLTWKTGDVNAWNSFCTNVIQLMNDEHVEEVLSRV